jgi:hypothetical protein
MRPSIRQLATVCNRDEDETLTRRAKGARRERREDTLSTRCVPGVLLSEKGTVARQDSCKQEEQREQGPGRRAAAHKKKEEKNCASETRHDQLSTTDRPSERAQTNQAGTCT